VTVIHRTKQEELEQLLRLTREEQDSITTLNAAIRCFLSPDTTRS